MLPCGQASRGSQTWLPSLAFPARTLPRSRAGYTEVTPLQLGAAYAAFVNGGRSVHPKVIAGVAELDAVQTSNSNAQVVSPTTAYMITNMLSDVVDHGTGRAARGAVKGAAIAGKTGTSHDGGCGVHT